MIKCGTIWVRSMGYYWIMQFLDCWRQMRVCKFILSVVFSLNGKSSLNILVYYLQRIGDVKLNWIVELEWLVQLVINFFKFEGSWMSRKLQYLNLLDVYVIVWLLYWLWILCLIEAEWKYLEISCVWLLRKINIF